MELTAYLHPGWTPLIRPAPSTRPWMDATPESFAYRCLPLNIANAHGWEVLCPFGFTAIWDGGTETKSVVIEPDHGFDLPRMPVSLFGQGVLTFHVEAIMRTPPGWNLWIGGSPNRAKDAIAPLTGVIETDWSPFTFTMNWRFTRSGQPVRFEPMEPFCFFFPVERAAIEHFEPEFVPLAADPATNERFEAWSKERDAFHARMQANPPKAPGDRWQKHYYRGVDVTGEALVSDHRTKLRLKPFDRTATPVLPEPPPEDEIVPLANPQPSAPSEELVALRLALAKREWLLQTIERQRDLSPATVTLERRKGMGSQEFLERHYAVGRPVILAGELDDWPARRSWNPEYLKSRIGPARVEYQGGRTANTRFEMEKDRHLREAPFDSFIDEITRNAGNDSYLTAYNSERNRTALLPLVQDIGFLDKFLTRDHPMPNGMMWIGPGGTFTSLHHDLTNNFIAQVVGRKSVTLVPAAEVGKLYNHRHVFSAVADLSDPTLDPALFPRLADVRRYDIILEPGEILFVPLGWWHQVKALSFSVTITFTNFLWRNDGYATYPDG